MRENIDCGLCDGQIDVARLGKIFHCEGIGELIGYKLIIISYIHNGFTCEESRRNTVAAGGTFFSVLTVAVEKSVLLQVDEHEQQMEVRVRKVRLNLVQLVENGLKHTFFRGFAGRCNLACLSVNPSQILDVRYGVDYRYGVFRKERLKLVPKLVKLSCLDFVDAVRGAYVSHIPPGLYLVVCGVRFKIILKD